MKAFVIQIAIRHIVSLDEAPNIVVRPIENRGNSNLVFAIDAINLCVGIGFK